MIARRRRLTRRERRVRLEDFELFGKTLRERGEDFDSHPPARTALPLLIAGGAVPVRRTPPPDFDAWLEQKSSKEWIENVYVATHTDPLPGLRYLAAQSSGTYEVCGTPPRHGKVNALSQLTRALREHELKLTEAATRPVNHEAIRRWLGEEADREFGAQVRAQKLTSEDGGSFAALRIHEQIRRGDS
jgi:hypothetical protein